MNIFIKTATSSKKPSESFILSYQELFTKQIVVLYEAYPSLTLRLSSSIITENFKSRLSALLKADKSKDTANQISAWEGLLRCILNGLQVSICLVGFSNTVIARQCCRHTSMGTRQACYPDIIISKRLTSSCRYDGNWTHTLQALFRDVRITLRLEFECTY
jgi:hypothetical protein